MMLLGKSSERKIPWVQLFIEAVLVVFSVLLALGVKSCRDAQVQEELANLALRNFKREIVANKTEIERVYSCDKEYLDTLKSENPPTGITLNSPSIQNNAWEAAGSTGAISCIDFPIIETASKIEEVQNNYQDFLKNTIQTIMNFNFVSELKPERVSLGLKSIATGIVNYESTLLELYDKALKKMKAYDISVEDDSTKTAQPTNSHHTKLIL